MNPATIAKLSRLFHSPGAFPLENTIVKDWLTMRRRRKQVTQFLAVFFVFVFSSVFSQTPDSESVSTSDPNRPFHPNVKTILLLTSYPVADAVTALALCDLLALRYGTDYLGEKA